MVFFGEVHDLHPSFEDALLAGMTRVMVLSELQEQSSARRSIP